MSSLLYLNIKIILQLIIMLSFYVDKAELIKVKKWRYINKTKLKDKKSMTQPVYSSKH